VRFGRRETGGRSSAVRCSTAAMAWAAVLMHASRGCWPFIGGQGREEGVSYVLGAREWLAGGSSVVGRRGGAQSADVMCGGREQRIGR